MILLGRKEILVRDKSNASSQITDNQQSFLLKRISANVTKHCVKN